MASLECTTGALSPGSRADRSGAIAALRRGATLPPRMTGPRPRRMERAGVADERASASPRRPQVLGVGVIVDTGLLVDLGVASVDVPLSAVGPSSGRRALGETRTVVQSVLYCVEMHDDDTPLATCELAVDLRDGLGNVLPIAGLKDPIRLAFEGTGTCVTWDGITWVQDSNVQTIRGVGTTVCETTHLTNFALTTLPVPSTTAERVECLASRGAWEGLTEDFCPSAARTFFTCRDDAEEDRRSLPQAGRAAPCARRSSARGRT